jgi:hypothetical protein
MKNITKFVICALLLCSSVDVYAKSSKDKKAKKERPVNVGAWKPFSCETGIAEESVTVQFPRKPFQEYDDGAMMFKANADFVDYKLIVTNLAEFESVFADEDLLAKKEEYSDQDAFKLDLLREVLQLDLDYQDEFCQFLSHNIYMRNGYPTLDAVEVSTEENLMEKTRIVITEYAVYILTSRHKVGLGDQHDRFVNSLKID